MLGADPPTGAGIRRPSSPTATGPFNFGEPARGSRAARWGDLWRASVTEDDTGLWAVEEGNDFVLRGAGGTATLVLAEGGRLVNADRLTEGDEVAVFGLPGEAPDCVGGNRGAA